LRDRVFLASSRGVSVGACDRAPALRQKHPIPAIVQNALSPRPAFTYARRLQHCRGDCLQSRMPKIPSTGMGSTGRGP
jgi:hypothetical protein